MKTPPSKNTWFRRWEGPMTRELLLRPGDFGLGKVPARLAPDDAATLVCGFCAVGCGLKVHLREGRAVNLSPEENYPVNLGMACPKGWEALTPLQASDRALTPWLRNGQGKLERTDWDTAMQSFTLRFKAIQDKFGPEAVAWLGTGQICTEELAFLGALAKFGMGWLHGDGNTRQCMATSVTAYKQSFGFDAPPYTYADFEAADVIVLIGSNLCVAHPILWQRVMRNRNGAKVIVIDPRKTETASCAQEHLAIRPKSDLALFYGVARLLAVHGWIDRKFIAAHTAGFEEFKTFVEEWTLERTAEVTGLEAADILRLAETVGRGRAVSFWWTMGVNQGHQATRTAQAIINLGLMTGNMGRPGTGANSITGQCNAMGSRLFSNTTNLLGGRDFLNPAHREEVARSLRIPLERIPSQNSLAYDQILRRVDEGTIKGLWIIATNTAHSWIDQNALEKLWSKLDFLVVQDLYHTTETARRADLILPAAGWGEKEGSFINSERRIGLVKKVARAPGQALSDFNIFKLAAHYWGCEELFREWSSPEAVFQILKRVSQGRPCDITGIRDYQMLDVCGGIQWPWPETTSPESSSAALEKPGTERRLFEDGRFFHPDGKARFIFEDPRPLPENPDWQFPFLLLTGRGASAQWHTQTRTAKSEVLRQLYPANLYVEINPRDAKRLRLRSGQKAELISRRGRVTATVHVTATVQQGQLFIPMHYETANQLTPAVFDPDSRQPAYKASAVKLIPKHENS
jgi:assimilatory nitrate reductase catalytic subunit